MKKSTVALMLTGSVSACVLAMPMTAFAQTNARESLRNDEIVVTAQRREQSLQDVSIAVTVVTGDQLKEQGVANINQLQNSAPNLEIEPAFGGGAAQFRLRGVGFQDYASNNSPTVGIYVNEVAFPVPVMTQGLVFDIERVEVLRGPQGTLYGRNTTGGAINFITRKPTDEFAAGIFGEYGRYNEAKLEGYVSGPLTDTLKARLAASTQQGGGWQHNRDTGEELGDADRGGVRGMLEFEPNDALNLLLDAHYSWDNSENQGLYLLNDLHTANGFGPTIPADTDRSLTGWGLSPALVADTNLTATSKPGRDNSAWGLSLIGGYDFGGAVLSSITSYESLDREEFGDWDSSSSIEADTFFGSDVWVFSQELRLSSHGDGPFVWTVGANFSKQDLNERYFSDFIDIFGTYGRVNYDQVVKSISVFGQGEYALSEKLKFIAGLRFENEDRNLNGFGTAFGGAQALPPTNVSTSMNPLTGKAGLEFRPVQGLMLYASASRGTKSGGFTTYNTGNSSAIQPFKPEVLWAYEVGFKTDLVDTVTLNGAAFYYDYKDQQVLTAVYGVNGPVGRFANAPKSKIWGAEVELTWRPVDGLNIFQSFGYKEGKYVEFNDLSIPLSRAANAPVYIDRADEPLPFPDISYNGSASYSTAVGGGFSLMAETNYSYHDYYPSWLGAKYDVPSYWLVNASVNLYPTDGPWSIGVWARNLFNAEYDLTRNFFTSADIAQPGRPRTYGVRLSADF